MNLNCVHNVYFIGVGGIGMSALARYFNAQGKVVAGYDRVRTSLTEQLEQEGVSIHYRDQIDLLPAWLSEQNEASLVVYTPAIPSDHQQRNYLLKEGFKLWKRSEVLGQITKDSFTLAVAGTHGKTTTSAMLGHVLTSAGEGCNAFLGGIATNYSSNVLVDANTDKVVVEADEFDRSFLTLYPDRAIVTSMDADHLDIYGAKEELEVSFRAFVAQLKTNGVLIRKAGLPLQGGVSYSIDQEADYRGVNIRIDQGTYVFDLQEKGKTVVENIHLGLPGRHNVENAVAVCALCRTLNMSEISIKAGLESFQGVKRRFEYQIKGEVVFIDDYAHHPEELKVAIGSVKELYPGKKVTGVFQPHLYTRTRDFAREFSQSLSLLDEVLLLGIYPARELPIEGVSSDMLLEEITAPVKKVVAREELVQNLQDREIEVLLTLGAGDIDQLVVPVKAMLLEKYQVEEK